MRLLVGGVLRIVIAITVGVFALRSVRVEDNVQIMTHRGSSKSAPENTMASIRKAIEDGADWVEIDVQETADGEVVVFHDSDFMKVAGRDLKIWDATMDDLREIDIGSYFSYEYHEERVPLLKSRSQNLVNRMGVPARREVLGSAVNRNDCQRSASGTRPSTFSLNGCTRNSCPQQGTTVPQDDW